MPDELSPDFRAFLDAVTADVDRSQARELTPDEIADMRAPFATGSGEDLMWKAMELVLRKLAPEHPLWDRLTEGQRAVAALWWTYGEVGNGGLYQFFYNNTGYVLPDTVAGARLLGDDALADNLERAGSLFGRAYPRDYDERHLVLERLPEPDDSLWRDLDDAVYPKLEDLADTGIGDFIEEHPDQFFRPN